MTEKHITILDTNVFHVYQKKVDFAFAVQKRNTMTLIKLMKQHRLEVGQYIEKGRKRRGWKQQQLAQLLGITKAAVSNWERYVSIPSEARAAHLDELFAGQLDFIHPGPEIRKRRRALRWTQVILADRAKTTSNSIARIERKEVVPRPDTLDRIIEELTVEEAVRAISKAFTVEDIPQIIQISIQGVVTEEYMKELAPKYPELHSDIWVEFLAGELGVEAGPIECPWCHGKQCEHCEFDQEEGFSYVWVINREEKWIAISKTGTELPITTF